ncbi:hypothetical protein F441_14301 [Phytophthora nicotianae CJ01A1]|uniref:M96 mating-specific protein family n=5 Tax=Phytophthora nicotianae TaxID=4792 RepID=W2PUQ8_PHYN3|nr:hypothetical protein PPTG_14490 [Phytophthora nicotianae INRA-310]ETL86906.1 hypothetical protein L917_13754 [Phytophthora nicotianae]ETN04672.1 hypothetical protein PPTG_14490 [Phytophthora nicotianae INRA-310]ETP09948.1 hypothetical protein F441_14301 [Phytophthora nicotianae CJ01A1]
MSFLLDDEDATFKAALSFVDDFMFDEDNTVDLLDNKQLREDGEATHQCSEFVLDADERKRRRRVQLNRRKRLLRKAGIYADPNRARNERKQEMIRLRTQLERLQLDAQVLRSRETKRPQNATTSQNLASLSSKIPAVWQELATRQRRRREKAERENIRLKLAVERQQQLALSLGELVQRRALKVTQECAVLTKQSYLTHHVVNVLNIDGDMEDFRVLFRHLEIAYRGLDAVFATNGLANLEISPGDVHLREGFGGRLLECFSHKTLPFEWRATTEATWEHFKGIEKHFGNGSLYTKAAKDLDEPYRYTIVENFTKELHSNNSRADITVKQVVRRYVERDRNIIIWVSFVAPAQIKHKMLRGLAYNLRGYAVTKRSPQVRPGQELSVLQQCSLISLNQDVDARCQPSNLQKLANFLIVNTAQNIRAHRERIENALVDQAVARRME